MDIKQVAQLLQRYRNGRVTPAEKELVERWYRQLVETGEWEWGNGEKEMMQQAIENRLLQSVQDTAPVRQIQPGRTSWWWVAAAVAVAFGLTMYFTSQHPRLPKAVTGIARDVAAPQTSKAFITLDNGRKVGLDSIINGSIVLDNNLKIVKLNTGAFTYQNAGVTGAVVQYNTLENPKGSKVINLILADGTKVWLNAGSAITYPVVFSGSARKVSVTGEAYFEVAHVAAKQFIVTRGSVEILVLGTHFNVNAFEDDDDQIKVTLLEGAVQVKNAGKTGFLKPGQQARINDRIKVVDDINIEMVMAWKNGYFHFENASLQSVLKQISRWYDIEVIYEGNNKDRQFVGEMERVLSLSEVLKILAMNRIAFEIHDRKLFIKPD